MFVLQCDVHRHRHRVDVRDSALAAHRRLDPRVRQHEADHLLHRSRKAVHPHHRLLQGRLGR